MSNMDGGGAALAGKTQTFHQYSDMEDQQSYSGGGTVPLIGGAGG